MRTASAATLEDRIALDRARFSGEGRIHVTITARDGIAEVGPLCIVLEPARQLAGSGYAVAKRLELARGERSTTVEDVAFGGYALSCTATAARSRPVPIVLDSTNPEASVSLELEPAGLLEGAVAVLAGEPLEDLHVILESIPPGNYRTTATDAAGLWRFEGVFEGEYSLRYGWPDSPIGEAQAVRMQAPHLRVPLFEVPAPAEVRIQVRDRRGHPIEGARLIGRGSKTGRIEGWSDATGDYRARYLAPGPYRLRVDCAGYSSSYETLVVEGGKPSAVVICMADG